MRVRACLCELLLLGKGKIMSYRVGKHVFHPSSMFLIVWVLGRQLGEMRIWVIAGEEIERMVAKDNASF
jgi:hypothetical protein